MEKISFLTQLQLNDFIRVNFHFVYRKWAFKFMLGLGIFMLTTILFSIAFLPDAFTSFPYVPLALALYFSCGLPVTIYFSAKRNYANNGRISEPIRYEIDNEQITTSGETFNATFSWGKVYSVTETKHWILIWQSKQLANVILKSDLDAQAIQDLRAVVNRQTGFKKKPKLLKEK